MTAIERIQKAVSLLKLLGESPALPDQVGLALRRAVDQLEEAIPKPRPILNEAILAATQDVKACFETMRGSAPGAPDLMAFSEQVLALLEPPSRPALGVTQDASSSAESPDSHPAPRAAEPVPVQLPALQVQTMPLSEHDSPLANQVRLLRRQLRAERIRAAAEAPLAPAPVEVPAPVAPNASTAEEALLAPLSSGQSAPVAPSASAVEEPLLVPAPLEQPAPPASPASASRRTDLQTPDLTTAAPMAEVPDLIKRLSGLAQREGVSGKISLGLSRAALRLERGWTKEPAARSEAILSACEELRSCLVRIRRSGGPADVALGEETGLLLAGLSPLTTAAPLSAAPPTVAPSPAPASKTAVPPSPPPSPPASPPLPVVMGVARPSAEAGTPILYQPAPTQPANPQSELRPVTPEPQPAVLRSLLLQSFFPPEERRRFVRRWVTLLLDDLNVIADRLRCAREDGTSTDAANARADLLVRALGLGPSETLANIWDYAKAKADDTDDLWGPARALRVLERDRRRVDDWLASLPADLRL